MKAFVAGATGYVGKAVVRHLVSRGVATTAHVRPDSSKLSEYRALFEDLGATVDTTAWEDSAMSARIAELEPDLVFGCLGTTRARKKAATDPSSETYEAIDYGLTAMLVRACASLPTAPRFVYVSSAGTAPSTGSAYIEARWKAESAIRDAGLPYTIGRPSFITGPNREEDRTGEKVGAALGDAVLAVVGAIGFAGVRDRYQSMNDDELGAALVDFAMSDDGLNKVLDARALRIRAAKVLAD